METSFQVITDNLVLTRVLSHIRHVTDSFLNVGFHTITMLFCDNEELGTGSLQLLIRIRDVNDNPPSFSVPTGGFNALLREDEKVGTRVIEVKATDADSCKLEKSW